MAIVTAPTGNVYVLDPNYFIILGSGEYDVVVGGITCRASTISNSLKVNVSDILKGMFDLAYLSDGKTNKNISWTVKQNGIFIDSGSFVAVYGSNNLISFSGNTVNLKWISRSGQVVTKEFCWHQDSRSINNTTSVRLDGLDYKVAFNRVNKITLYADLVGQTEFEELTAIQESEIVQIYSTSGWIKVSVVTKEYKRTKEVLQDFDITIILPDNER